MARFRNNPDRFAKRKALEFFSNFIRNHKDGIYEDNTFRILEDIASTDELVPLIKAEFSANKLKKLESVRCLRNRLDLGDSMPDILIAIWRDKSSREQLRSVIQELIQRKMPVTTGREMLEIRMEELRKTFQLSEFERDVLLALFFVKDSVLELSPECKGKSSNGSETLGFLAKSLDCTYQEAMKAIAPQGKLRRYHCINEDLEFNSDLSEFLSGITDEPLASKYFRKFRGETLPWEFYGELAEKHGSILKKMIRSRSGESSVNILLYGVPGTGKTSFARTLAAELGLNCYCIAQSTGEQRGGRSSTPEFRFGAVQVCDFQVDHTQSLMIVDEADEMLRGVGGGGIFELFGGSGKTVSSDKGLLNSVLDSIRTPTVWITNTRAGELDESSRRRFDYSIRFDPLNSCQRLAIWRNNVAKLKLGRLFNDAMLVDFARRYATSAGGITLVLQNIAKLKPARNKVAEWVEKLMAPHCELLNIPRESEQQLPAQDYSIDGLNIRGEIRLERIIQAVRNFRNDRQTGVDRPRMNLLLSGPPGSGKSEFVKFLGTQLNTKVVVRMGSDLLSMYVGGTEQNIRRAFAEAEAEKAILFLDEIDGLLQNREHAQRNWEVTQVNELLYQMENFSGVLFGATNFSRNLDPATLRRFTFKLEFDYLDNAGKAFFFERMFHAALSDAERRELEKITNLTPGDFRTVRQSFHYLGDKATNRDYMNALARESELKKTPRMLNRKMGF